MKTFRTKSLTSFILPVLAMSFIDSLADANAMSDPNMAGAPADPVGESAETKAKRAAAANFLPIVRGRLPLLLVHAVRFDEVLAKMGNKDLAAKLATSVGKVFDIRKGRNFAYLTADYKPTPDDVAAVKAWAAQVGAQNAKGVSATGDTALLDQLVAQYTAQGLGTAEDTAKLTAARGALRPASVAGEPAAAAADGSVPAKVAKKNKPLPAAKTTAGSADELLG